MRRAVSLFPILLAFLWLFAAPAAAQPAAPDTLAGLTLGAKASDQGARLELKSAKASEETPWLNKIRVTPDDFFKAGYVMTGRCAAKGRILRIKLVYREASLEFFRKLVGTLLERYGNPAQYKGDLGGDVMGNKWSFTNADGESISLIIQRAQNGDPDISQGVVVKLANQTLMEAERSCYGFKHGEDESPVPSAPQGVEACLPR